MRPIKFAITSIFILSSLSLQALGNSNSANCQRAVNDFLKKPDQSTLQALSKYGESRCSEVITASNDRLNRLNEKTALGNPWAAQYLAESLNLLDGGNLEDALVALGQFSEHDMQRFLTFARKGLVNERGLRDALTMLPPNVSDDPHAQLRTLSRRKQHVKSVTRSDLQQQKRQALKAIDDFAAEIRAKSN